MARITSQIEFVGKLGAVSAYKMKGIEGVIIRSKGGPSKSLIKRSPKFEKLRQHGSEFGGRSRAVSMVRAGLGARINSLADYNFAGALNAVFKPIQDLEDYSKLGHRDIILSKNPRILEGFSLNNFYHFDTVVRGTPVCTVDRENWSATIDIPEMVPGITFAPQKHAMFGFIASLFVMPDLFSTGDAGYRMGKGHDVCSVHEFTAWQPVLSGSPATTMTLKIDKTKLPPDEGYTIVLALGMRYGAMTGLDQIEQVKRAGCAKIFVAR